MLVEFIHPTDMKYEALSMKTESGFSWDEFKEINLKYWKILQENKHAIYPEYNLPDVVDLSGLDITKETTSSKVTLRIDKNNDNSEANPYLH